MMLRILTVAAAATFGYAGSFTTEQMCQMQCSNVPNCKDERVCWGQCYRNCMERFGRGRQVIEPARFSNEQMCSINCRNEPTYRAETACYGNCVATRGREVIEPPDENCPFNCPPEYCKKACENQPDFQDCYNDCTGASRRVVDFRRWVVPGTSREFTVTDNERAAAQNPENAEKAQKCLSQCAGTEFDFGSCYDACLAGRQWNAAQEAVKAQKCLGQCQGTLLGFKSCYDECMIGREVIALRSEDSASYCCTHFFGECIRWCVDRNIVEAAEVAAPYEASHYVLFVVGGVSLMAVVTGAVVYCKRSKVAEEEYIHM